MSLTIFTVKAVVFALISVLRKILRWLRRNEVLSYFWRAIKNLDYTDFEKITQIKGRP